jgi:predicted nucleotidyltransferase
VFDERTLALGATFTLETDVGKVDLLGEVEPLGSYDDLLARAETYLIDDREVRTIGLEDLIRVKEFIGRAKDQASLDQLYAIRQLRNEEQLR